MRSLRRFLNRVANLSFLFQMKPNDPVALLSAVAALAIVPCIAVLLPARRAMRVDPMVTLRYEWSPAQAPVASTPSRKSVRLRLPPRRNG